MNAKPYTVFYIKDLKTTRRTYATEKAARNAAHKALADGKAVSCTLVHKGEGEVIDG